MEKKTIIFALGSNSDGEKNIGSAKALLEAFFPDTIYTRTLVTKAIGMEAPDFHNCMAKASTCLSLEDITEKTKEIERLIGRDKSQKTVVAIDIDILQYGSRRLHGEDWNRDYVQVLIGDLI